MMSSLSPRKHHPFLLLLRDRNAGQLTGELGAEDIWNYWESYDASRTYPTCDFDAALRGVGR